MEVKVQMRSIHSVIQVMVKTGKIALWRESERVIVVIGKKVGTGGKQYKPETRQG